MMMKIRYSLYSIMLSFLLHACSGMYDNLSPYYDEGEANYIAKADSVFTKAGKNRVQITWKVNTDPRIKDLYITWNDGANTATVPIDFNQLDENRYCSVILDPIDEGSHVFYLYHTGNGHMSVPTETEGTAYGDRYQNTLEPRAIRSVTMQEGKATLIWKTSIENCEVEITYTNIAGIISKRSVPPTEITTVIEDVLPGSPFSYVSTYLPDKEAIDDFSITSETMYFPE